MKITFEFIGGPHDGKVVEGARGAPCDADRYYLFSNHGAIGSGFKVASDFAVETLIREGLRDERRFYFQRHYYVVTRRRQDEDEVFVRANYVLRYPVGEDDAGVV